MKRDRELSLVETWERLPSARRHFYFFTLLVLATISLSDLYDVSSKPRRVKSEPPPPPRMTSKDVYPAPVKL